MKQGDTISSELFMADVGNIFWKMSWKVKINAEYLYDLQFANDLLLISESSHELQEMLNDLNSDSIDKDF